MKTVRGDRGSTARASRRQRRAMQGDAGKARGPGLRIETGIDKSASGPLRFPHASPYATQERPRRHYPSPFSNPQAALRGLIQVNAGKQTRRTVQREPRTKRNVGCYQSVSRFPPPLSLTACCKPPRVGKVPRRRANILWRRICIIGNTQGAGKTTGAKQGGDNA